MPTAPRPARSTADPWAACTSPHQVDLSSVAGRHPSARRPRHRCAGQRRARRRSAPSRSIARAPAAPSITSAPSSPGSSATVSWSFTTPEGTTTRCRVDTGAAFNCAGSVTRTFTIDGLHRFTVVAIDPAGNRSATTMAMYTLDRVAPVPPTIVLSPTTPDRVTTPQWTFVIEPDSAGECSIDGSSWVPCTTTFSADLSAAADGLHTFAVRSVDAAGNVGAPTHERLRARSHRRRACRSSPAAPPPYSDDDTPTWSFTVDADATAWCRVDDGPWTPCAGSLTADPGRGVRRHPLARGAGDRRVGNEGPDGRLHVRARSPGARRRRPHRGAAVTRQRPHARVVRSPTSRAPSHGARSTARPPVACDGTAHARAPDRRRPRGRRGRRRRGGEHEHPDHQHVRARHASRPPLPLVTPPRTPDRDVHPEWGIEVEPGTVAECSFDGGDADGVRRDLHRRPRRPRRHPPPVGRRPRRGRERLRPGHQHLRARHHRAGGARAPAHPRPRRRGPGGSASRRRPPPSAPSTADRGPPAPARSRAARPDARCASRSAPSIGRATALPSPARPSRRPWRPRSSPLPPTALRRPHRTTRRRPHPTSSSPTSISRSGAALRPPVSTLAPLGQSAAETVAEALLRGIRPQDGPFAGPVRELLQTAAETTTIPVLVILVVIAFVAVQNRIDRRDPKLAAAPAPHTSPSTWSSIERRRPPDPAAPTAPTHRGDERARAPDGARAVARARPGAAGDAHACSRASP